MAKLDTSGGPDACHPYTGSIDKGGYGQISVGARGERKVYRTHRVAYEALVGPIPEGHDIGHKCHDADPDCPGGVCPHRRCGNGRHLLPETRAVNVQEGGRRLTRCKRKHLLDDENTYVVPGTGRRSCRKCRAMLARRFRFNNPGYDTRR